MPIKKCKLNTCAHCPSKENLEVTFSSDGKMYFACPIHFKLLQALTSSFEAVVKRIQDDKCRAEERVQRILARELGYN